MGNFNVVNPVLGEVSYPVTYNQVAGGFTGFSGTITLSANSNLANPPFSGTAAAFAGTLAFFARPAGTTLSAGPTDITLTIPHNSGTFTKNGYIASSSFTPGVSASGSFVIQFSDGDFYNTVISLSANSTTVEYLPAASNLIDNILFVTGPGTFRSIGRHIRVVQGGG